MIKYLYIDDDAEKVKGIVNGLNKKGVLQIDLRPPKSSWEEELNSLVKKRDFDGLILDLRLDITSFTNSTKKGKALYRGTSIAQELRQRITESQGKTHFPIVLFSADDRIKKSYDPDRTVHDLFDQKHPKSFLEDSDNYSIVRNQLLSLVQGYQHIQNNKRNLSDLLSLDSLEGVDFRLIDYFRIKLSKTPVHVYARFIIQELLNISGALIEEKILAARLGIDIDKSKDWKKLLALLEETKYTGAFGNHWQRWWWHLIEKWWTEKVDKDSSAINLNAKERVELLLSKLKLKKIKPIEKQPNSESTCFWTICKGSERPLDPLDGILIGDHYIYAWQDEEYISIDAALEEIGKHEKWNNIHPTEKDRLIKIKKLYSNA